MDNEGSKDLVEGIILLLVFSSVILLVVTAIIQKTREYFKYRSHQNKRKSKNRRANKKYQQVRKAARLKLKILTQPQNKKLFDKFVDLLDNIDWPEYPLGVIDETGRKYSPSLEELEDYEEELEDAVEEENKMYTIFSDHLKTKGIVISESELSHVVDLYRMRSKHSK